MPAPMKRIRLDRWATQMQPPRNPRIHPGSQTRPFSSATRSSRREIVLARQYQVQWQGSGRSIHSRRAASTSATAAPQTGLEAAIAGEPRSSGSDTHAPATAPRHPPPIAHHASAAKLAALHARLSLPPKLPLSTLQRCLIDSTADPRPDHDNRPLAVLGQDLLGYYTSEHLITHYPRLPMGVLFAAQYAYVGAATLGSLRKEWGVDVAAAPGEEVERGLLQLGRVVPGKSEKGMAMAMAELPGVRRLKNHRRDGSVNYRRGMSSRVVYDDEFGDLVTDGEPYPGAASASSPAAPIEQPPTAEEPTSLSLEPSTPATFAPTSPTGPATTVEAASATFVRSLFGALYLHAGTQPTKSFHAAHILSRHLDLHTLFHFTHPTRDLSRLCARENFEPPVARLISETGRLSRTPVFVVGVYSGEELLGEGAGASLDEARVRAAAAALRGWYLYSPAQRQGLRVPSDAEGKLGKEVNRNWRAGLIDPGEIVT